MVDSTSDAIIADPKAVISKLFDASLGQETPDISSDFDIPKTFKNAFTEQSQVEKIPRLDTLPASAIKTGRLVRFLGMVQDTSYSQEIYVGMTRDQATHKWSLHRYGEAVHVDVTALNDSDKVLDERNGVYVTSIPGAARWLESSDSLESLSLEDPVMLKGDKDRIVAQGQKEVGVVVKCYSRTENEMRVCDLVEVIGILEIPDEDTGDENALVIHAVTFEKKRLPDVVLSQHETLSTANMVKAKDLFIRHVTSLFEGDALAAQSLLLNLTSCLTHRHPIPLGFLPINIYATPAEVITNLTAFLRSVVPALAVESLSIDALNSSRIYPKSDGDKLSAGRGQLVSGTTLLINDTMQEGKLEDTGVRNLRFLSRIAVAQKLSFEFPYHEFEIDTDIPVLVLGASKTILPVILSFPHVKGESIPSSLTQGDLELLRCYLSQISQLNVSIDPSTASEMQDAFVKKRKEAGATAIDETWFGTRIVVAKGIARNNGRENVSPQDWQESLQICSQWETRRK